MNFIEENLTAVLAGGRIGSPLYFFPELSSTNSEAFQLAAAGAAEGAVVVADHQTNGRGRMQRVWVSPRGVNLYVSLILRPEIAAVESSPLTIMAGVAVAEVLAFYCPRQVKLKWPNDVLINGKKVCGILAEMKTVGKNVEFVVIGIGLNINMPQSDFTPPLEQIATSLCQETGKFMDRVEVTARLLAKIGDCYELFLTDGIGPIREKWLSHSQLLEKFVEVSFGAEVYRGKVTGMDEGGALIIRGEKGERRQIIAGDARVIRG